MQINHPQFSAQLAVVEAAFERRADLTPNNAPAEVQTAVQTLLAALDAGVLRVAEKIDDAWVTHQTLKKAVLLSFRLTENSLSDDGVNRYFDKVPTKFAEWETADFQAAGFRATPGSVARKGSFVAKNVVLMPSYVNIGAYVDEGAMVDTWVTVGSC
ncbi:MAG: 2,3,4,5-tetrahydropyridine-2,6-dicarboxylate N-succinyltransferase, partial [Neisseriaceae bacterium]|nr:2,3,4,5-tetrahydropyridine-2,6-dicarboxylate N-succinyltransferase [Neisseriaceae bacterium]